MVVTNPDTQSGKLIGAYTYLTCSISLSGSAATVGAAANSGTFGVTATSGCGWTAIRNASWINTTSTGAGNGTVAYSVAANTMVASRSGTISVGVQTYTINQNGVVPSALVATATSSTSISLTWSSAAVDHFEVWRNSGAGFVLIASPASTSYGDNTVVANTAYVYRVRAIDSGAASSAFSNHDVATTIFFTDDPLIVGVTVIKAVHITELRQAVNALRVTAGVGTTTFTDTSLTGVTVKLIHLTEIRSALDPALSALSLPAVTYTSATMGGLVKEIHISEVRAAVK